MLKRLFEADWQARSPHIRCTRLPIAPINARQRLLDLIDGTPHPDIETTQLADEEVRSAVLESARAGVAVRVIPCRSELDRGQLDAAAFPPERHGIPANFSGIPASTPRRSSSTAAGRTSGSVNLTRTSISEIREIGLITRERPVLDTMAKTFDTDWARAVWY